MSNEKQPLNPDTEAILLSLRESLKPTSPSASQEPTEAPANSDDSVTEVLEEVVVETPLNDGSADWREAETQATAPVSPQSNEATAPTATFPQASPAPQTPLRPVHPQYSGPVPPRYTNPVSPAGGGFAPQPVANTEAPANYPTRIGLLLWGGLLILAGLLLLSQLFFPWSNSVLVFVGLLALFGVVLIATAISSGRRERNRKNSSAKS